MHLEVKMPRTSITISNSLYEKLQTYIKSRFGEGHRALSAVIQQAVKEFLEKEKNNEKV